MIISGKRIAHEIFIGMFAKSPRVANPHSPFLVLVTDEELVELLPLELELVLCVLLDGLLVSDGVVLIK